MVLTTFVVVVLGVFVSVFLEGEKVCVSRS